MNNDDEKFRKLEAFLRAMCVERTRFPEHAREIDRAIFSVLGKTLDRCPDRNCSCQMSFEKFHDAQNRSAALERAENRELN